MIAALLHRTGAWEQAAIVGGWPWWDIEVAYYRKRRIDEEEEKWLEQERIVEEAERIARETAVRDTLDIQVKRKASARAIKLERAEIERLEIEIELLQAEMNRTYREEMARRRAAEEQEMMDIIFMLLMEV